MFALKTPDATLIAAGIAAATGLLKLVSDAFSARGTATRAAHRHVLEPHLAELAVNVHGVMAGAVVVHRRLKDGQAPGQALQNSQSAADALKESRLAVKYSLPGLEEPLRTLTRVPDWIATYKGDSSGDRLVERLQRLSRMVDATISRSYRRGRPPSRWEQWRLGRQTMRTRHAWENRFGGNVGATIEDAPTAER